MHRVVSPPAASGSWVPELKPLLDLYLGRVRDRLGESLSAVALYGSVARGQAQAASDVDLFVVHRGRRAAVFLARKLASLRLRLRELGSRRVELADGSWYWDLKPDVRPGEVIAL